MGSRQKGVDGARRCAASHRYGPSAFAVCMLRWVCEKNDPPLGLLHCRVCYGHREIDLSQGTVAHFYSTLCAYRLYLLLPSLPDLLYLPALVSTLPSSAAPAVPYCMFHKGVPLADEIYKFITDLLIDALIQCESACSCENRAFVKKRRDGLDKDKVKGFDDPTRNPHLNCTCCANFVCTCSCTCPYPCPCTCLLTGGGAAMLNIFADFLEAMFWQVF